MQLPYNSTVALGVYLRKKKGLTFPQNLYTDVCRRNDNIVEAAITSWKQRLQQARVKTGVTTKGGMKDFCGDRGVPYLGCVSILIETLHGFARGFIWGELDKGNTGSLCVNSTSSCDVTLF